MCYLKKKGLILERKTMKQNGSFSPLNRPPRVSDEIAQLITERIDSGGLQPGTKLPSESMLAKEFGVGRSAVREAIAKLRQDGLVTSQQGVGAFVSKSPEARAFQIDSERLRTSEDLRSIMELRLEMEVGGAAMAARRRTKVQLQILSRILDDMKAAVGCGGDSSEYEQEFHRATAEATNNKYFRDFVNFLASRIRASLAIERTLSPRDPKVALRVLREYGEIFSAIKIGDPDKARRAAWYHLLQCAERLGLRGLQGWEESRMTLLGESTIPVCAASDPSPRAPRFRLPAGACDCHAHVFGPESRYPYTRHRTYTPPDAPLSDYKNMLGTLGLERAVIVQPSVYGTDNRATLDAIKEGGENFRGIVVVDDNIDTAEMERMHEIGVRGVRVNLLFKSGIEVSDVRRLADKIAPFGWHLQMLVDVSEFSDIEETLGDLPVEVVFDHMGHLPTSVGVDHPGFQEMLRLLKRGRSWAKLSGSYRITGSNDLPYEDVTPFAKAIIAANPERVVWASDWPHPYINVPMPNDGGLLDLLDFWAPDIATRNRILVDNPAKLYDF